MTGDPDRCPVVLLVEDDPGDRELMRRAWAGRESSEQLCIVRDGEEAMDYLRHSGRYSGPAAAPRPDLVLLDLNLPKLDGFEVLQAVRSDRSLQSLSVVVLTTSERDEDRSRARALGVTAYITKPIDRAKLRAILQTLHAG